MVLRAPAQPRARGPWRMSISTSTDRNISSAAAGVPDGDIVEIRR
jgi:hypothetical protein